MSPIQVLIDEGMSAQLGLEPGDRTSIAIGAQELEVEVTGISREMIRVMTLHQSILLITRLQKRPVSGCHRQMV